MSTETAPRPYAGIPFTKVKVTTDDNGILDAPVIDGKEWPNVRSAAVFLAVGQPLPKVALEVYADKVEFDGYAEVVFFEPEGDQPDVPKGMVLVREESLADLAHLVGHLVTVDDDGSLKVSAV